MDCPELRKLCYIRKNNRLLRICSRTRDVFRSLSCEALRGVILSNGCLCFRSLLHCSFRSFLLRLGLSTGFCPLLLLSLLASLLLCPFPLFAAPHYVSFLFQGPGRAAAQNLTRSPRSSTRRRMSSRSSGLRRAGSRRLTATDWLSEPFSEGRSILARESFSEALLTP